MRIVLLFFTALFALPLAAQEIGAAQQLRKLMQVYRYLDGLYVDEVEMGPLVESAIEGMLEELDPHSAYIGAEDMKGVQESFDGEFSGIGIEFNVLRDTVIVVNTIVGGPAERVGVMPNDRIVRIDTLDAVGFKQTDVPKHLRGKTGTRVEIDVVRHGEPGASAFRDRPRQDSAQHGRCGLYGRRRRGLYQGQSFRTHDDVGVPRGVRQAGPAPKPDPRPAGQRRRIAGAGGRNGRVLPAAGRAGRLDRRTRRAGRCRCATRRR